VHVCQQRVQVKRFGQVVISAGGEPCGTIAAGSSSAEQQYGCVIAPLAQRVTRLQAGEVGHRDVHDDDVDETALGAAQGLLAVGGGAELVTRTGQHGVQDLPQVGVVIDDQHGW
jgi:hypothetical protein